MACAAVIAGLLSGVAGCAEAPRSLTTTSARSGSSGQSATSGESEAATASSVPTPDPPYIESATWAEVDGRARLVVVPTEAGRVWVSHEHALVVWRDVVALAPGADTAGMQEQFECHAQFAPRKPEFNVEPWRPAVPYRDVVAAACNPRLAGAPADADQELVDDVLIGP